MDQKIFQQLEELQNMIMRIEAIMVTKDDLKEALDKQKEYLEIALDKQAEDFGEVVNELFTKVDEQKADSTEISSLKKRVIRIESKFAA